MTPYELATLAQVASPDSPTSPGALWLTTVAESVGDMDEWPAGYQGTQDAITEMADQVVPVYTHERWQVFVDLAAYREDLTEFRTASDDMTALAALALYAVAERLLTALVGERVA